MTKRRPFRFEVARMAGTALFRLEGRLRGDPECHAFQEMAISEIAAGVSTVVLDFAEVDSIDARGIAVLAGIRAAAERTGAGIVLASVPHPVGRVLDVFQFLKALPRVDSGERRHPGCRPLQPSTHAIAPPLPPLAAQLARLARLARPAC
jgi:anti-anti-sigma factor